MALATLTMGFVAHVAQQESSVNKLEREARSRGLFDHPAKHQRRYAGPDTPTFFKGLPSRIDGARHSMSTADNRLLTSGQQWRAADTPSLHRAYAVLEPHLAQIRGSAMLPMNFSPDWDPWFDPVCPEIMGVHCAVRELALHAKFLVLIGKRQEALQELRHVLELSQQLERQDLGTAEVNTWFLRRRVLENVARLVAIGNWPETDLMSALALVQQVDIVRPTRNSVRGRLLSGWRVATDLKGALDECNSSCTPIPTEQYVMAAYPPAKTHFQERVLRGSLALDDWLNREDLGTPKSLIEAFKQEHLVEDKFWDNSWVADSVPRPFEFAFFILRQRSAKAAVEGLLEALVTKSQTGRWPTRLQKSLDPFTDKPVEIQVQGSGITIRCNPTAVANQLPDPDLLLPGSSCSWPDSKKNRI